MASLWRVSVTGRDWEGARRYLSKAFNIFTSGVNCVRISSVNNTRTLCHAALEGEVFVMVKETPTLSPGVMMEGMIAKSLYWNWAEEKLLPNTH